MELKACPLCEGACNIDPHNGYNSRNEHEWFYEVRCTECGLHLDMCDSKKEDYAKWNRRAMQRPDGGRDDMKDCPLNQSVLFYIPNAEHYGPGIYRGMRIDMGTGERWHVSGLGMGRDLGVMDMPTAWQPLPPPPIEREG